MRPSLILNATEIGSNMRSEGQVDLALEGSSKRNQSSEKRCRMQQLRPRTVPKAPDISASLQRSEQMSVF
ncbi:hypothetical protein CKAN_02146100 [Cinnamomum micranthum f. kanehirae]|uniref:Uncharacterized protein n=1 Tax=Cinnamomum micranthum f. kanehirae TaxID=337451 RepID=A0A3S4PM18_9MAGN|nr:hypothetical protein CKAN_02146100 [Cinnamomum micranthum f. kanehirae]